MTKYNVTRRGVVWCIGWFGVAIAFLGLIRSINLEGWFVPVIYFTILLVPMMLMFWNRFTIKLGLEREVQS